MVRRPRLPGVVAPKRFLVVLAVAAVLAAVFVRPWITAQAQAIVVLAAVVEAPGLSWMTSQLTDEPQVIEARVAGVPATVLRPNGKGPWPTIVLLNGATPLGRRNEHVQALAEGFARGGYHVVVPDLPGLRRGEITIATLDATVDVAEAAARSPLADNRKTALFGVSTGGSLALLAAEQPRLADRVTVVAAMGAFTDIRAVQRLATTGTYRDGDRIIDYKSKPFLALAAARSLVAALPIGAERRRLLALLERVDVDSRDPLARLRALPRSQLDPPARAVVALLANRDPGQFEELYAALPAVVRGACRRLSPFVAADQLQAPVLLATAENDAYFPSTETTKLAARAPAGTVAITRTISHAAPGAFPDGLAQLARLNAFLVRALRLASA